MKPARDHARTRCPNDDTLGALVQHALAPDDRARVTAHLDECDACQRLVVAAVRGGVATTLTEDNALQLAGPREPSPIDGRGMYPAGSAAEWQRGSIDGRGMHPAGSAAEGQRGSSIDRGEPRNLSFANTAMHVVQVESSTWRYGGQI